MSLALKLALAFMGILLITLLKGYGVFLFILLEIAVIVWLSNAHPKFEYNKNAQSGLVAFSLIGVLLICFISYLFVRYVLPVETAISLALKFEGYSLVSTDYEKFVELLSGNESGIYEENKHVFISRYWAFMLGSFWFPIISALTLNIKIGIVNCREYKGGNIFTMVLFIAIFAIFAHAVAWSWSPIADFTKYPGSTRTMRVSIPMPWMAYFLIQFFLLNVLFQWRLR